jgi:diadenylate cyclase
VGLNDVAQSGRNVDAVVSTEMLCTLFYPGSPLHDGAVLLRGDRIAAAGCLLPLTERDDVGMLLGTRHRAALGLSEYSDAAVVVVSEETGAVSLTHEGKLYANLPDEKLKGQLLEILQPGDREGHGLRLRRKANAPKPEL